LFQRAHIKLKALPAVYPKDYQPPLGHIEMRKVVKQMMAEEISRMRQDA
jgi:hypothetical protein